MDNCRPVTGAKLMRSFPPRLRKNQRLEKRWGDTYYAAVKEAVFNVHTATYTPAELPPSLRNETDDCQPLYVCQQCKDCFRFLSSFEAHNSRRSWILGYWCHNCFFVDCCHVPEGQPSCSDCQKMHRQRKSSLRAKGFRKGRKLGAIHIFYNQCQFFAHLNNHQTIVVDLADIMLMPVPTDVDRESYSELDRLCANIMERMFLTRTHIMDWLGSQQLGNKWWKLLQASSENGEDPLEEIFAASSARTGKKSVKHLGKSQQTTVTGLASPAEPSPGSESVTHYSRLEKTHSSISETIESVIAQSGWDEMVFPSQMKNSNISCQSSNTSVDPLESVENDENPRTTADIAFVDCGPAANTYPPDVAIVLPPKDKLKIIPNTSTGCSSIVMPAKAGHTYPSFKARGAHQEMKQHQGNNIPPTTSVSTAFPATHCSFEPKISVKNFANELLKPNSTAPYRKNYSRFSNQKPQRLRKLAPASTVRITNGPASLSSSKEIIRAVEISKKVQGSLATLGPRILTVHSPKNADLSKIISQLPPDVINGKKIVFIGQDAEPLTILPKNETISSGRGMIKIQSETDKAKILQTLPTTAPNFANEQSMRITSETSKKDPLTDNSKPKSKQVYLDGKVIYRNGKKFVIRQTRKIIPDTTICNSLNSLKLQTIPKPVTLTSFLSKSQHSEMSCVPMAAKPVDTGAMKVSSTLTAFLTSPSSSPPPSNFPSPSTSEDPKSSTLGTEITQNENVPSNLEEPDISSSRSMRNASDPDAVEYFTIKYYAAGKLYVDFTAPTGRSLTKIPGNHRRRLLKHLCSLSSRRISEHIDHLRSTNSEYSKLLGVKTDARIIENLAAIEEADKILKNRLLRSDEAQDTDCIPGDDDYREILSTLEETKEPLSTCPTCNKPAKSKSHIAGFLDDSVTDLDCCSCNNYICHICGLFQGNMIRFAAHLNFHAKTEPFTCPECFKKFTSFDLLETHVWTTCFHPLARRWFRCRVCQFEGFLDMESLTKHFVLAHSTLKIGCTQCGMLLKSRAAFEKHRNDDHLLLSNSLKPLYLMVCEFGNCIVRLKDYRSHMEDHRGVIKMLYYKCFFCPYLIKEGNGGREQIQIHLRDSHSDELSQLVPSVRMPNVHPENTEYQQSSEHLEHPEQSNASEDNPRSDNNPLADIYSDENDQLKDLTKLHDSESMRENTDASTSGEQSSTDYLDAKLSKQTLKNGVECRVWSINLEHPELPDPIDLGTESLEIISATQEGVNTSNNVITEYSSSPKIFDVRSVTPDSYAHLGRGTKEQINVVVRGDGNAASSLSKEGVSKIVAEQRASEKSTIVSEGKTKDSIRMKMFPVKLSQVLAVNQGDNNMNLPMLQSSLAVSKRFVKLSDLRNLDKKLGKSDETESSMEPTDRRTVALQTRESSLPAVKTGNKLAERCKSFTNDSTTVTKFRPGSVEVQLKLSVDGKKLTLPVSLLKSKNNSTQHITIDTEPINHAPHLHAPVPNVTNKEVTTNPLLCNIPKPPPLARMPQLLQEASPSKVEVEEIELQETNVSPSRSIVKLRQRQKRPWRIALNGPTHTSKLINYNCHLCGEVLNTSWSVLRQHFSSRHCDDYKLSIVTPRLLQMSSDFISEGYKEVLGSRKRKADLIFPSSKRRKRWNPRKHVDNHSLGPGLCVRQESVQDGEGNFVCKKCDQQCNDISSLRQHIGKNHRIKDHYLVCLECGENFVVEPSLQMHLKAFHRIQDPCTYMAQNTGYTRKLPEVGESESSTGIANQCHVCMAVFEDKLAVDKHLRVHGMAFLNRKRIEAQNAARNPEKKAKIYEPEDSLAAASSKNVKLVDHELGETELLNGTLCKSQESDIKATSS